jgi:hypothetical protein
MKNHPLKKRRRMGFNVKSFFLLIVFAALSPTFLFGSEWRNLDDEHRLGGRKCSSDYLVGKVVLVCSWSLADKNLDAKLTRMQELWESFKSKNFVLLGSCRLESESEREKAKKKIKSLNLTFPQYESVTNESLPPVEVRPEMSVMDAFGELVYSGNSDRRASELFIERISYYDTPINKEELKSVFDFEFNEKPARALIRFAAVKKDKIFSKDKELINELEKKADELKKIKNIQELVSLVTVSLKHKDCSYKNKTELSRASGNIESAIKKYSYLKNSDNKEVAREAKGALADLKWALVRVKKR